MSCIKIRLTEELDYIPERFKELDGYIYLDLDPNFEFRETKQITEIDSDNSLSFNFSLGFDLPATDKNFAILKSFSHINVVDNSYSALGAQVVSASTVIDSNELFISGSKKSGYVAEMRLNLEHWGRLSQKKLLSSIEMADFEFTKENVEDVISNRYPYDKDDEENIGIWFPLVDYGNLDTDNSVSRGNKFINRLQYWRPWYYLSHLLDRGFCELGWKLESPLLLDSDWGKRILTYFIRPDYGLDEERIKLLDSSARVANSFTMPFQYLNGSAGRIKFPDILSDESGNFNADGSTYIANGEVNVEGKVRVSVAREGTNVTMQLVKINKTVQDGGSGYTLDNAYGEKFSQTTTSEDQVLEFDFEVENISITDEERLIVLINKSPSASFVTVLNSDDDDGDAQDLEDGSYIRVTGVRKYWDEGRVENLAGLMRQDIPFIDLIKAATHAFGLKWYTDLARKRVLALQPYEVELMGSVIEGFFIESNIEDITLLQDPDSYETDSPESSQPRYVKFAFAESDDPLVNVTSEDLWSHTEDLGDTFTVDETEEWINKLFEPTANRGTESYRANAKIACMAIGGDFEHNWDIGPRISFAYGRRDQGDGEDLPSLKLFTAEDDALQLIPLAAQYMPDMLGDHDVVGGTFSIDENNVVFGINSEYRTITERTLYYHMYRRWVVESIQNMGVQYLLDLTDAKFRGIDFRSYYLINHLGRTSKVRIPSILDYHYCSPIFTQVNFVPDRQSLDLCNLITGDPTIDTQLCENSPVLICTEQVNCYLFTVGGVNNAPIESVSWEVEYNGDGNWLQLVSLSLLSAELCNQTNPFRIRATITYDEIGGTLCPPVTTPPKSVDPCPEELFEINCITFLQPPNSSLFIKAEVRALNEELEDEEWQIVSFEYSNFYGPVFDWQPYDGEQFFDDNEIVLFRATVQLGNCPPIDLDVVDCTLPQGSPNPCSRIDLGVECVESSSGCVTLEYTGSVPGGFDVDYFIKYRVSDDGVNYGPWLLYDGREICFNYIQARVYVHYCDDACPMYCSEMITCESCDTFVTGEARSLAVCNDGNL